MSALIDVFGSDSDDDVISWSSSSSSDICTIESEDEFSDSEFESSGSKSGSEDLVLEYTANKKQKVKIKKQNKKTKSKKKINQLESRDLGEQGSSDTEGSEDLEKNTQKSGDLSCEEDSCMGGDFDSILAYELAKLNLKKKSNFDVDEKYLLSLFEFSRCEVTTLKIACMLYVLNNDIHHKLGYEMNVRDFVLMLFDNMKIKLNNNNLNKMNKAAIVIVILILALYTHGADYTYHITNLWCKNNPHVNNVEMFFRRENILATAECQNMKTLEIVLRLIGITVGYTSEESTNCNMLFCDNQKAAVDDMMNKSGLINKCWGDVIKFIPTGFYGSIPSTVLVVSKFDNKSNLLKIFTDGKESKYKMFETRIIIRQSNHSVLKVIDFLEYWDLKHNLRLSNFALDEAHVAIRGTKFAKDVLPVFKEYLIRNDIPVTAWTATGAANLVSKNQIGNYEEFIYMELRPKPLTIHYIKLNNPGYLPNESFYAFERNCFYGANKDHQKAMLNLSRYPTSGIYDICGKSFIGLSTTTIRSALLDTLRQKVSGESYITTQNNIATKNIFEAYIASLRTNRDTYFVSFAYGGSSRIVDFSFNISLALLKCIYYIVSKDELFNEVLKSLAKNHANFKEQNVTNFLSAFKTLMEHRGEEGSFTENGNEPKAPIYNSIYEDDDDEHIFGDKRIIENCLEKQRPPKKKKRVLNAIDVSFMDDYVNDFTEIKNTGPIYTMNVSEMYCDGKFFAISLTGTGYEKMPINILLDIIKFAYDHRCNDRDSCLQVYVSGYSRIKQSISLVTSDKQLVISYQLIIDTYSDKSLSRRDAESLLQSSGRIRTRKEGAKYMAFTNEHPCIIINDLTLAVINTMKNFNAECIDNEEKAYMNILKLDYSNVKCLLNNTAPMRDYDKIKRTKLLPKLQKEMQDFTLQTNNHRAQSLLRLKLFNKNAVKFMKDYENSVFDPRKIRCSLYLINVVMFCKTTIRFEVHAGETFRAYDLFSTIHIKNPRFPLIWRYALGKFMDILVQDYNIDVSGYMKCPTRFKNLPEVKFLDEIFKETKDSSSYGHISKHEVDMCLNACLNKEMMDFTKL